MCFQLQSSVWAQQRPWTDVSSVYWDQKTLQWAGRRYQPISSFIQHRGGFKREHLCQMGHACIPEGKWITINHLFPMNKTVQVNPEMNWISHWWNLVPWLCFISFSSANFHFLNSSHFLTVNKYSKWFLIILLSASVLMWMSMWMNVLQWSLKFLTDLRALCRDAVAAGCHKHVPLLGTEARRDTVLRLDTSVLHCSAAHAHGRELKENDGRQAGQGKGRPEACLRGGEREVGSEDLSSSESRAHCEGGSILIQRLCYYTNKKPDT